MQRPGADTQNIDFPCAWHKMSSSQTPGILTSPLLASSQFFSSPEQLDISVLFFSLQNSADFLAMQQCRQAFQAFEQITMP